MAAALLFFFLHFSLNINTRISDPPHLSQRCGEVPSEVAVILLPILRLTASDLTGRRGTTRAGIGREGHVTRRRGTTKEERVRSKARQLLNF